MANVLKMRSISKVMWVSEGERLEMLSEQWQNKTSFFGTCSQIVKNVARPIDLLESANRMLRSSIFFLEMVTFKTQYGDNNDLTARSESIIKYAETFAPQITFCFQDFRPYIKFVVAASHGDIWFSREVKALLDWTLTFRENHSPGMIELNGDIESPIEKTRRRELPPVFVWTLQTDSYTWHLRLNCWMNPQQDIILM